MNYDQVERSRYDSSKFELYRFETEDGINIWTYTTDRTSLLFATKTYIPEVITRSAIEQSSNDSSAKRLTITLPWNLPVAALHVPYLPPRPVKVTIYSGHRTTASLDIKQNFVGYITSFAQKGDEAEFNVSTVIDGNGQPVPWPVHTSECAWAVYEDGCYAVRAAFQVVVGSFTLNADGTVMSAANFSVLPDPDWLKRGYIINNSTGERRFIVDHNGTDITLNYPFINIAPGALLVAYAGCDLSRRMCIDKFNNIVHRMSFDHMPDYNLFAEGVKA